MRKMLYFITLCIAGVLFNRLFSILAAEILFIPLYLDTVMTIAVTLIAGPLWGVLTGAFTNIIAHTISSLAFSFSGWWAVYLFTFCNIATALITWLFVCLFPRELNFNKKPEHPVLKTLPTSNRINILMDHVIVLTLLSFVLCIAISALGGLIAYFIGTLQTVAEPSENIASAHLLMFDNGTPLILREILSRIPINIIDRFISVFAGYGIASAISHLNIREVRAVRG